jgi:ribosome-binding protein aMBF1 (putative translation factor)
MSKKKLTNALEILDRRYPPTPEDLAMRAEFEEAFEIAETIYAARTEAGLTQRELAKRVGTSASVICRLEDADYEGHSMAMLRRIAEALGKRVELRFVPDGSGKGQRRDSA